MISPRFRAILAIVLVLSAGLVLAVLHLDTARLQRRVGDLRQKRDQIVRLRAENQRTRELMARAETGKGDVAVALRADLLRTREEIKSLEEHARENRAKMVFQTNLDADNSANNRDPEKGMTRLEHFQDVGQATPNAAFQTFVWAAMKGNDDRMAAMITWKAEAREKAMAAVAALPAETREKYATPEKLTALFFAAAFTALPSAQIIGVKFQDSNAATVSMRGLPEAQQIPMQLGVGGWQIIIPPQLAEKIGNWALRGSENAKN